LPLVPVDLAKGEQHSDAYRAINPRRVVPTLVLKDGTAIGRSWHSRPEVSSDSDALDDPSRQACKPFEPARRSKHRASAVLDGVRTVGAASDKPLEIALPGPPRSRCHPSKRVLARRVAD